MLPDLAIAVFLAVCLTIFACVNLCNLKRFSASKKRGRYRAEVRQPSGSIFILAALGTLIFFLESVLYIVLVFTGFYEIASGFFFQLRFPFSSLVQFVGIFATVFGYALFLCSVLARGRYAVSWEMPENHKLVTWSLSLRASSFISCLFHLIRRSILYFSQLDCSDPVYRSSKLCTHNNCRGGIVGEKVW